MSTFIVAAKRTPFGSFGGKFKDWTATRLGAVAASAALEQLGSGVIPSSVIIGNVAQTSADGAYLARHVALQAGLPVETPSLTVNRLCGSGFQSIVNAVQEIRVGDSEIVLSGGAESMSQAPYALRGSRWGMKLGVDAPLSDTLWESLTDAHAKIPMAITAENLAEKYNISKAASDEFALESQQRWAAAQANGRFAEEIVPITVKVKRGEEVVSADEGPRPDTTLQQLEKLKPLFKKGGTVSAGNASGISDGAGAVIVASEAAVSKHDLKPLARIVSYHVAGVPPEIMGFGPVPAIQGALEKASLTLEDMDLIEINEAFAPQFLACSQTLGLDMSKTNTNGGAIALGHPTGASGSRIMGHLTYELQRTNKKFAVGSACIGGGQGIAIIIERC